jgi:4-diphosphocytidyl-2-C-methyl-D-erythritol kinase
VPVTTVTVRAPAKINLGLRVGARGADGFHPIVTVYQAIALYDEVKARPAPAGEFSIAVTGEGEDVVPLDDGNLAVRAARALAELHGVDEGVALSIHKTIAVAGGLAGGSADAAGALVACDALWGTRTSRDDLAEIAAGLGSDVPFCLVGGSAVGTGRGEQLSPVLGRGTYQWVLAYADDGLSTADVYDEHDRHAHSPAADSGATDDLLAALRGGDPYVVGAAMHNDLGAAARRLRPALGRTLQIGDEADALAAMVSGSGPTVVFLASDDDHAVDIAVALSGSGTCRSVQRAYGPVPGARVVG